MVKRTCLDDQPRHLGGTKETYTAVSRKYFPEAFGKAKIVFENVLYVRPEKTHHSDLVVKVNQFEAVPFIHVPDKLEIIFNGKEEQPNIIKITPGMYWKDLSKYEIAYCDLYFQGVYLEVEE